MDADWLHKIELFKALNGSHLESLKGILHERLVKAGTRIFKEGDVSNAMFLIADGKVRISKAIPGAGEEALAILEPGQHFGEMSLIEHEARSADAVAHIDCRLFELNREDFEHLMFTDREFAYVMLWTFVRALSGRLRETNDKLKVFFALSSFGPR